MTIRSFLAAVLGAAILFVSPLSLASGAAETKNTNEKRVAAATETKKTAKQRDTKRRKEAAEQAAAEPVKKTAAQIAREDAERKQRLRESEQSFGFFGIFGAKPQVSSETRAMDASLAAGTSKKFKAKPEFEPQEVAYDGAGYAKGTIVVDTKARFLYLIQSPRKARRYAIAVGREGLLFTGTAEIGDKQEWPRWIPTKAMQEREPKKYGQYKDGMEGGPENPLGARAIYLYQGKRDTHIRIHGTNQPQTIGSASSNGCFRMINDHVIDLYGRVRMGGTVVVL